MTRYLTRDAAAVAAAVLGPLALAAVLLQQAGTPTTLPSTSAGSSSTC